MNHNSTGLARLCNANDLIFTEKGLECANCGAHEETIKIGHFMICVNQGTLDESPMAYKPMDEIISNIGDTVEIVDIVKPVYNFKAGGE
jgi:tRNA-splicing ligase RtcB (3'-phosphate/5'-hydroxy nucleic acid ligase)